MSVTPDEELYASLDLGGTTLQGAIGAANGRLLVQRSLPTETHRGPDRVIERMLGLLAELREDSGATLRAVGVGCPGLVDRDRGVTRLLPNFPGQWRDVELAQRLERGCGLPVHLLNDVRMATLGELYFGHGCGRPSPTMALFAVGTGVGGGVVVDGRLRLGRLGAAGELGHMTVEPRGPRCGCGNRGCVESVASGPALVGTGVRLLRSGQAPALHRLTGGEVGAVTPETMAEAAAEDEPIAEAIDRAGSALGIAVANVVVSLYPELVVIGGGVALIGERLLLETH